MRLSNLIKDKLKLAIKKSFGDVEVYLFGSRLDDNKRGGDIDLAIKSNFLKEEFQKRKIKFIAELLKMDFDYKIDVVDFNTNDLVLKEELKKAKRL